MVNNKNNSPVTKYKKTTRRTTETSHRCLRNSSFTKLRRRNGLPSSEQTRRRARPHHPLKEVLFGTEHVYSLLHPSRGWKDTPLSIFSARNLTPKKRALRGCETILCEAWMEIVHGTYWPERKVPDAAILQQTVADTST